MNDFDLNAYDFDLPESLIAQYPIANRSESRLLVLDRSTQSITHARFQDLPNYYNQGDLFVANDTRVIPARFLGNRIQAGTKQEELGGHVEAVLLKKVDVPERNHVWECLFKASARAQNGLKFKAFKQISEGDNLDLKNLSKMHPADSIVGELLTGTEYSESGTVLIQFSKDPITSGVGRIPLPTYIDRRVEDSDLERYQTVYSRAPGSAAAPTAGLHFTTPLIDSLKSKGCQWETCTLHVGLGTFRPIKSADIREHKMHSEYYEVSNELAYRLAETKKTKHPITAIGTTSLRTLESYALSGLQSGSTQIFIYPGFKFKWVDRLITNFHLPKSTLLALVSAFAGREFVLEAYQEAIKEKYRFFSYGDAMLIL